MSGQKQQNNQVALNPNRCAEFLKNRQFNFFASLIFERLQE